MSVSDNYMHIAIPAIAFIRLHHKSHLPIEIWHAGDELSLQSQELLKLFHPLTIRDITEFYPYPADFFRGFQIKGFIGEATEFDEFLLMDADVFLYMPPEELFNLPEYKNTGAFFFRDNSNSVWKRSLESTYVKRQEFITGKIEKPSPFLPKEWHYYWKNTDILNLKNAPRHHVESGVVLINKTLHKGGVSSIRQLNENFEHIYQFILGDKETFWIGLEENQEPYTINDTPAFSLIPNLFQITYDPLFHRMRTPNRLVHCIHNRLCFQQKTPIPITSLSKLVPRALDKTPSRYLTPEEEILIKTARLYYQAFNHLDLLCGPSLSRVKQGHG